MELICKIIYFDSKSLVLLFQMHVLLFQNTAF